jgi:hypothetical protein
MESERQDLGIIKRSIMELELGIIATHNDFNRKLENIAKACILSMPKI